MGEVEKRMMGEKMHGNYYIACALLYASPYRVKRRKEGQREEGRYNQLPPLRVGRSVWASQRSGMDFG